MVQNLNFRVSQSDVQRDDSQSRVEGLCITTRQVRSLNTVSELCEPARPISSGYIVRFPVQAELLRNDSHHRLHCMHPP